MSELLKPANSDELLEIVKWAVSDNAPLQIKGLGSKDALGRPIECPHIIELSSLNGITLYEPG